MAAPINYVPNFDPNKLQDPSRTLSGPVLTGNVTLNTPYTNTDSTGVVNKIFARWLYVGTTGNINYTKYDGSTQTLTNVVAGVWHPIFSTQVNSASTTASGLVWGA